MKYYIGLDVSLATTAICAVDENGAIVREGVAASDPDEIADWLEQLGVAVRASGARGRFHRRMALQRTARPGFARSLHRSSSAPRGHQNHAH